MRAFHRPTRNVMTPTNKATQDAPMNAPVGRGRSVFMSLALRC